MSYADGNKGARRKLVTGGAVALIQIGVGVALINGLAVHFLPHDPPRHLPAHMFPTKPIVPPKVEPTKTPQLVQPHVVKTTIDAPLPRIPIAPLPLEPSPSPSPSATETGVDRGLPTLSPSPEPTQRFIPKSAAPRGDRASWVTTDDYPPADVREGHTGTVRFRVAIDTTGRVSSCTIVASSGYEALDNATCRNVIRRARFDPARDGDGRGVTGTYESTIRWVIPRD